MTRRRNQKTKHRIPGLEQLAHRVMLDAAGFVDPVFYGPTSYLSEADLPAGFIPVDDCPDCVFELETFEDGELDPDITLSEGEVIGPGFRTGIDRLTDSVDGDDGVIDGTGQTDEGGYSYFTFGNSITVTLPGLMQSAGLVWTDGSVDVTNVIFEAFDERGASLGTIEAGDIADDQFTGSTGEDSFFGVSYGDGVTTGVSEITITNIGGQGIEIDHIQYANCSECCDIDLELTKTVSQDTVTFGESIDWTITVTNNAENADIPATGVTISDVLPDDVTFQSASATDGSFDDDTGIWTLADALDPGESETLTITTSINAGLADATVLTNTAQVQTANEDDFDSTPGNDDGDQSEDDEASATTTLVGLIDLEVIKTVSQEVVNAGDTVTWEVTLSNNPLNANTTATGVTLIDVLPDGLNVVSVDTTVGNYNPLSSVWQVGELAPGAEAVLTIETTIADDVVAGQTITNIAGVSSADQEDFDSRPLNAILEEDDEDDAFVRVASPDLMLSGFSYVDTNNDGIFQAIELPLMGVEIQLVGVDEQNNSVERTTFTNVDGFYKFNDLAPGNYTVTQTQPVQFVDGLDTLGNLGGDIPANDTLTVELTANGEEYNFGELGLLPEYVNKRLYLTSTPYTNWEYIDVRQSSVWYSFNVEHQTFIELFTENEDATITVRDEDMDIVATVGGGELSTIGLSELGQYYLEIVGDSIIESLNLNFNTPTVNTEGNVVIAVATAGDDDVQLFLDDTTHVLSISGLEYEFDASVVDTFHIGAATGDDSVTVYGTDADDLGSTIGTYSSLKSDDYDVHTYSFDNTTLDGGDGTDKAHVYGSLQDDYYYSFPQMAKMTTPTTEQTVTGFERIDGFGRGGNDRGILYGSVSDDLFISRDAYTVITGTGTVEHTSFTKGFERVDAFGRSGSDSAYLYGNEGDDTFVSTDQYASLRSAGRQSYTKGFEQLKAVAGEGGNDTAHYYGLVTGDVFTADFYLAALARAASNRNDEADRFDIVNVNADSAESPELVGGMVDYVLNANVNWLTMHTT